MTEKPNPLVVEIRCLRAERDRLREALVKATTALEIIAGGFESGKGVAKVALAEIAAAGPEGGTDEAS